MAFAQQQLIERLKKYFPDQKIELNYENEFQLLIVIILSAQTTDKKVNQVSPILF
jgi:endonuclease-3